MYIVFEGADGVGKTTQAKLLVKHLSSDGKKVLYTKEPGGTKVGTLLRDIALSFDFDVRENTIRTVLLADYVEHMESIVIPSTIKYINVISDRGINSALVYQGIAKNKFQTTRSLYKNSSDAAWLKQPDLVIWIDMETKEAIRRLDERGEKDRHDSKPEGWHNKIRNGYYKIFESNLFVGKRYVKIDGIGSEKEVHKRVKKAFDITQI